MGFRPKRWILGAFLLPLLSCTQEAPKPSETQVTDEWPSPSPTALSSPKPEAASAAPEALATLAEFKPVVNFRRSRELVWEPALLMQELVRFDAVQTQDAAKAKIQFKNGSELDMAEKTLVVIDRNQGRGNPGKLREDRAVLRSGKLKGRTRHELWLLTSSSLIKLRSRPKAPEARVDLSVIEGKVLKVVLNQGEATLLTEKADGVVEKTELQPSVAVEVPAPKRPEAPGAPLPASNWNKVETPAAPEITMQLTEPVDQILVKTSEVWVRGRISASGGKVLVNGQGALIAGDLSFSVQIPLNPGANLITIQLIRPSGQSVFVRRTVIRSGP